LIRSVIISNILERGNGKVFEIIKTSFKMLSIIKKTKTITRLVKRCPPEIIISQRITPLVTTSHIEIIKALEINHFR